jgi:RNA polymerase sigma factor (sigma-70 family)
MSEGQPHDVLPELRGAGRLPDDGGTTDGRLLERFVSDRDEAAFEALVRRHGPMVLGVCRRLLHNPQDAEDAFQATFLVLVRKAAAVGRRELLGNWLYGVAYRTALDARSAAARRRARERQVSAMPEPEANDGADVGPDLRPLLDQELSRLPDKYRVPVVLCDLQGGTRRGVAEQLGVPEGTLSGRLTTARRMLARRLARRGLVLSAGALTAALSPGAASACVPAPLLTATVGAATALAAGPAAVGVVSAPVAALTEGVLKAMLVKKLKVVTAVLLAVGALVGAAAVVGRADKKTNDPGAAKVLRLADRGRRVAWAPDGKTLLVVTKVEKAILGFQYDRRGSAIRLWDVEKGRVREALAVSREKGLAFSGAVFSADGKMIAATVSEEVVLPDVRLIRTVVKVWDAKTLALKLTLGGNDSHLVCVAFSPDGKRVAAGDPGKKTVQLWDAGTGAPERALKTEEAQPWSLAFSPDGKSLAVGGQFRGGSGEVSLWDVKTGKLKHRLEQTNYVNAVAFSRDGQVVASGGGGASVHLWVVAKGAEVVELKGSEGGHRSVAFSPDGRLVAAGGLDGRVRLWDVKTGELKAALKGHTEQVYSVAFSPDGKTLASTGQDQTLRLWPVTRGADSGRAPRQ